jgi:hypothetical protein
MDGSLETVLLREIQSTTDSTPHPIIPIPKGPKNRSRHHRNQRSPDLRYPARRSLLWARRNRTFRHPILNPVQGQTRCQPPAAPDIRYKGHLAAPARPEPRRASLPAQAVPRISSERVVILRLSDEDGRRISTEYPPQTFHHQSLSSPYFSRALVTRATKFFASTGARTLASLSK